MINYLNNLYNKISGKYLNNNEAVIIACYYNPQRNKYRKKAFDIWYDSVKHLNVQVIEATLTNVSFELDKNIVKKQIVLSEWLWHKEYLLNLLIKVLPNKYKYVFWLDTDVIFTNKNWLIESCEKLEYYDVIQPFEICTHLDKDDFTGQNTELCYNDRSCQLDEIYDNRKRWKSYGFNAYKQANHSDKYDIRGHVGFAWGAKREFLDKVGGLFENAKIGGADGIMAYACKSPYVCDSIKNMFGEREDIAEFTWKWFGSITNVLTNGVTYTNGELLHVWHGDTKKREYYKRIKEFSTKTTQSERVKYFENYMYKRETVKEDDFLQSAVIGYVTDSTLMGTVLGGNPIGALLGDSLNQSNNIEEFKGFQGGDFDGGGAEGTWENYS